MSEATARAHVKSAVDGVSNVGIVHDYERWSSDWSAFLDLFKTTIGSSDTIRGWTITCSRFPQERMEYGNRLHRTYNYVVRGFFGLNDADASEKAAMIVVEDVVEALDDDSSLNDPGNYFDVGPASLEIFEPRVFGGTLCHYAEIVYQITEFRDAA